MRVEKGNFSQPKPNLISGPSTIQTSEATGLSTFIGSYKSKLERSFACLCSMGLAQRSIMNYSGMSEETGAID